MRVREIYKRLPHRYPFLLLDKIIKLEKDICGIAIKNVSFNEPYFTGHFPSFPIMPGVLIIEALAQLTALVLMPEGVGNDCKLKEEYIGVLASVDKMKFLKPVFPGDQLYLYVNVNAFVKPFAKVRVEVLINKETVAKGELSFGVLSSGNLKSNNGSGKKNL